MRKILFRGKRLDNGEWIQGFLALLGDDYYIAPDINAYTSMGGRGKGKCMLFGHYYQVLPETVGQFTGLTDKNGKKIFENDICRYDNGEEFKDKDRFSNYVVQWDSVNTRYVVVDEWNCEDILDDFFSRHAVVIGNIHDTPELLEGKS